MHITNTAHKHSKLNVLDFASFYWMPGTHIIAKSLGGMKHITKQPIAMLDSWMPLLLTKWYMYIPIMLLLRQCHNIQDV